MSYVNNKHRIITECSIPAGYSTLIIIIIIIIIFICSDKNTWCKQRAHDKTWTGQQGGKNHTYCCPWIDDDDVELLGRGAKGLSQYRCWKFSVGVLSTKPRLAPALHYDHTANAHCSSAEKPTELPRQALVTVIFIGKTDNKLVTE